MTASLLASGLSAFLLICCSVSGIQCSQHADAKPRSLNPETLRRVAVILPVLVDLGSLGVAQVVEERLVDR